MSTWFEPSGFMVQTSLSRTNAIFPFAPGKLACAGGAASINTTTQAPTTAVLRRAPKAPPPRCWLLGRVLRRCQPNKGHESLGMPRTAQPARNVRVDGVELAAPRSRPDLSGLGGSV